MSFDFLLITEVMNGWIEYVIWMEVSVMKTSFHLKRLHLLSSSESDWKERNKHQATHLQIIEAGCNV